MLFRSQHANVELLVGHPTTVGLYPKGRSDAGLADMAGNVWEWMGHAFVQYYDPFKKLTGQKATDRHTLRGGSWFNVPDDARCAYRRGLHPDRWYDIIGFRVVLSLAN